MDLIARCSRGVTPEYRVRNRDHGATIIFESATIDGRVVADCAVRYCYIGSAGSIDPTAVAVGISSVLADHVVEWPGRCPG